MRFIAGVFGRYGGMAPDEVLDALLPHVMGGQEAPVHRRTGDDWGLLARGTATLDREAAPAETGPDAAAEVCLVLDGRLDHRSQLAAELAGESSLDGPSPIRDGELVLAAYRRWGAGCAGHLVGDFSFLLWDGGRRRLICARDPLGVRTLFHGRRGGSFLFASQLAPLHGLPGGAPGFEEEFFADYLVHGSSNNVLTPFTGLRKLPPGHAAVVGDGELRLQRVWHGPDEQLRYAREDEYTEHFLDLFEKAVARRLAGDGPVFCDLSGGLDSPSIVCVADRQRRRDTNLHALTVVFDEARESDEREWANLVAGELGLPHHRIRADDHPPFEDALEGARFWDEPHAQLCSFSLHRRYVGLIRGEHGGRVLLGGMGAEEVLTTDAPEPLHLADLLREGRFGDLRRELRSWQEALDVPLHRLFLHNGLKPLLFPRRNYYLARSNRTVPDWAEARFARRWDLRGRLNAPWMERRYGRASRQWQWERLHRIAPNLPMGYLGKHVEMRYPFLDRDLVEFGLAVPWEHKVHPYARKPILRRAMRGILPEALRTRLAKVGADHQVYLAIARHWEQLEPWVRDSRLAAAGWVDGPRFVEALRLARHGHSSQLAVLFWTLAAELWVRAWDER